MTTAVTTVTRGTTTTVEMEAMAFAAVQHVEFIPVDSIVK